MKKWPNMQKHSINYVKKIKSQASAGYKILMVQIEMKLHTGMMQEILKFFQQCLKIL